MRIFNIVFECTTPLHCGGGEDVIQDQPVVRDSFGHWRIPGSSIAGALRALVVDDKLADKLFGYAEKEQTHPSLVWCEDALLLDFDGVAALKKKLAGMEVAIPQGPFIRDHVKLDLESGTAVEAGKFDMEIVPAGARFQLELRCDGWNRGLNEAETKCFDALCAAILAGQLPFGGKSGIGYGKYKVINFRYIDLDLRQPQDMEIWLARNPRPLPAQEKGRQIPLKPANTHTRRDGLSGSITIPFICDAPMLIGGGENVDVDGNVSEADMVFARSPLLDYGRKKLCQTWTLPGSAIKGVLRHAMYAVLTDLHMPAEKAKNILDKIFGHVDGEKAQRSRISIADCLLTREGKSKVVQHVAIDRFTGGALDGALFNEEPLWLQNLQAPISIQVDNLDGLEAFLLFQALLNMASGQAPLGSGAGRGNGRLKLPHWPHDAQKAFASFAGDLAWNGKPLLTGENALAHIQALAKEWDADAAREGV